MDLLRGLKPFIAWASFWLPGDPELEQRRIGVQLLLPGQEAPDSGLEGRAVNASQSENVSEMRFNPVQRVAQRPCPPFIICTV
jgi:hypothetical protein